VESEWEKWGEALKPTRQELAGFLNPAIKWPWPAKNNFAFQGIDLGPAK